MSAECRVQIDLTGKVALVTGGSRGIGAAAVRLFTHAGAEVAFTFRTRRDEAGRVGPHAYRLDLSGGAAAHDALVAQVVEDLGGLDFFVANAGIWPPDDVAVKDMSDTQWAETLRINLDAVFFGCRAVLRAMRPGGSIVIVTSTAAQRGEGFHADYAATKGALISFVKSLAVEAAPEITVNSVAPGWVDTEMCATTFAEDGGRERARIEAGIPLRRVAAPDDIAGPIVFLCSPLARHVTGEILNVNGGAVLCG